MEYVSKIQEASDLARMFNKDYLFNCCFSDKNLDLIIHQVWKDGEKLELTQDEFNREFKKLKKEFEHSENAKKKESIDKSHVSIQNTLSKSKRKEEILRVTNETKKRTETLEEYLRVLDIKGIYGKDMRKKK